jgi:outer membrane biosynthesis protein TonB
MVELRTLYGGEEGQILRVALAAKRKKATEVEFILFQPTPLRELVDDLVHELRRQRRLCRTSDEYLNAFRIQNPHRMLRAIVHPPTRNRHDPSDKNFLYRFSGQPFGQRSSVRLCLTEYLGGLPVSLSGSAYATRNSVRLYYFVPHMIPRFLWRLLFGLVAANFGLCGGVTANTTTTSTDRKFEAVMSAAISGRGDYWKELTAPGFEPVLPNKITPLLLPSRAWAELEVTVGKDGKVRKAAITRQSDSFKAAAAKKAISTIKGWTFLPAKREGNAIDWTVVLHIKVMEPNSPALPAFPVLQVNPRYIPGLFSNTHTDMPGVEKPEPVITPPLSPRASSISTMDARPRSPNAPHNRYENRIPLPDGTYMTPGRFSSASARPPLRTIQIIPDSITFEVVVAEDGSMARYSVNDARFPAFLPAAIDALRASKWSPGSNQDGHAQTSTLTLTLGNWGRRTSSLPGFIYLFEPVTGDSESLDATSRFTKALFAYDSPVYPTALAGTKQTGEATVEMVLDREGVVSEANIINATAPEFGYSLQAAMLNARFQSAAGKSETLSLAGDRIRRTEAFYSESQARNFPASTTLRRPVASQPDLSSADLDTPLTIIYKKTPVVSPSLGKGRSEGFAEIAFTVNPAGLVCEPQILQASAPEFGYAAAHAIFYWVYEKPTKAGAATACTHRVRFDFKDGKFFQATSR